MNNCTYTDDASRECLSLRKSVSLGLSEKLLVVVLHLALSLAGLGLCVLLLLLSCFCVSVQLKLLYTLLRQWATVAVAVAVIGVEIKAKVREHGLFAATRRFTEGCDFLQRCMRASGGDLNGLQTVCRRAIRGNCVRQRFVRFRVQQQTNGWLAIASCSTLRPYE